MVKIFISVRNRLAITKKCIEAIKRHSEIPNAQIYVYDNATNYLIDEHFKYFADLYKQNQITQVTFTSETSTFNAFSKASTCNFFGQQHEQDPSKDKYDFLLMLDNDVILKPGWDVNLKKAWNYVTKNKLNNVKVIGQSPGGIKHKDPQIHSFDGLIGRIGLLGGSGLWSVRPNFFRDVGFLDLNRLVGQDKKHDQFYWQKMQVASGGRKYIMGIKPRLAYHVGAFAGSVCNRLTKNRRNLEMIKFEDAEKKISDMTFDKFYEKITHDVKFRGW
jgi:hypothetical protein